MLHDQYHSECLGEKLIYYVLWMPWGIRVESSQGIWNEKGCDLNQSETKQVCGLTASPSGDAKEPSTARSLPCEAPSGQPLAFLDPASSWGPPSPYSSWSSNSARASLNSDGLAMSPAPSWECHKSPDLFLLLVHLLPLAGCLSPQSCVQLGLLLQLETHSLDGNSLPFTGLTVCAAEIFAIAKS